MQHREPSVREANSSSPGAFSGTKKRAAAAAAESTAALVRSHSSGVVSLASAHGGSSATRSPKLQPLRPGTASPAPYRPDLAPIPSSPEPVFAFFPPVRHQPHHQQQQQRIPPVNSTAHGGAADGDGISPTHINSSRDDPSDAAGRLRPDRFSSEFASPTFPPQTRTSSVLELEGGSKAGDAIFEVTTRPAGDAHKETVAVASPTSLHRTVSPQAPTHDSKAMVVPSSAHSTPLRHHDTSHGVIDSAPASGTSSPSQPQSIWSCWMPKEDLPRSSDGLKVAPSPSTRPSITELKLTDDDVPLSKPRLRCSRFMNSTFLGVRPACWVAILLLVAAGVVFITLIAAYMRHVTHHLTRLRFDASCLQQTRIFAMGTSSLLISQSTIARTISVLPAEVNTTDFILEYANHAMPPHDTPMFTSLTYCMRVPAADRSAFESSYGPILAFNNATGLIATANGTATDNSDDDAFYPVVIRLEPCTTDGGCTYRDASREMTGYQIPLYVDLASLPDMANYIQQMGAGPMQQILPLAYTSNYSAVTYTPGDESVTDGSVTEDSGYRLSVLVPTLSTDVDPSSFTPANVSGILLNSFDLTTTLRGLLISTVNHQVSPWLKSALQDADLPSLPLYLATIIDENVHDGSETIMYNAMRDVYETSGGNGTYVPASPELESSLHQMSSWPVAPFQSSLVSPLTWRLQCRAHTSIPPFFQTLVEVRTSIIVTNSIVMLLVSGLAFLLCRWHHSIAVEKKQKHESLMQMHEAIAAAEAARDSKTDFMAFLCHELRNPLFAVLSMSDSLKDTPLDADQSESVFTIHASSELMLAIADDILDLSKIDAGKLELDVVHIDLFALIQSLIRANSSQAQERGITVVGHIDPRVPRYIQADPTRLNQIITNLMSNAIKFSHKHGEVRLEVELEEDEFGDVDVPPPPPDADTDTVIDIQKHLASAVSGVASEKAHDVSLRLLRTETPMSVIGAEAAPNRISSPVHAPIAVTARDESHPFRLMRAARRSGGPPASHTAVMHGDGFIHLPAHLIQRVDSDDSRISSRGAFPSEVSTGLVQAGHSHHVQNLSDGNLSNVQKMLQRPISVEGRTLRTLYPASARVADEPLNFAHPGQQPSPPPMPIFAHEHFRSPLPNSVGTPISTPLWSSRTLANGRVGGAAVTAVTAVTAPTAASTAAPTAAPTAAQTPIFAPAPSPAFVPAHYLSTRKPASPIDLERKARRSAAVRQKQPPPTHRPSVSKSQSYSALFMTARQKVDAPDVSPPSTRPVRLAFKVVDRGCGIPSESIAVLFEPYSQAKRSITRSHGGTGLGLAIVKKLCDLMQATIHVESEVEVGTTFAFSAEFLTAPPPSATIAQLMRQLPQQGTNETQARYHNYTSLAFAPQIAAAATNEVPYPDTPSLDGPTLGLDSAVATPSVVGPGIKPHGNRVFPSPEVDHATLIQPSPKPFTPRLPDGFPQVILTPALPQSPDDLGLMDIQRQNSLHAIAPAPQLAHAPSRSHLRQASVSDGPSISACDSYWSPLRSPSIAPPLYVPPLMFNHPAAMTNATVSTMPIERTMPEPAAADDPPPHEEVELQPRPSIDSPVLRPAVPLIQPSVTDAPVLVDHTNVDSGGVMVDSSAAPTLLSAEVLSLRPAASRSRSLVPPEDRAARPITSKLPRGTSVETSVRLSRHSSMTGSGPSTTNSSSQVSPLMANGTLAHPPRLRLLVVDDAAINRKIMHKMLDCAYDIDDAVDGLDALNQIKAHPDRYACVLMDLMMPVMSGSESLIAIRASGLTHLPCIAVTANTQETDIEQCLEIGFTAFLSKPCRKDALRAKVREVIQAEAERAATATAGASPMHESRRQTDAHSAKDI